jgi:hypothetical protein
MAGVRSLVTRIPAGVWLAMAASLLTFAVYYYISPRVTGADNFVFLADSFLHGRVDVPFDPWLPFEWSIKDGKHYIIPPPMPAIVILPGVLIYGVAMNQALASIVIGSLNASVVTGVVRGIRERLTTQVWLIGLFMFGTIFWYTSMHGGVWFFSHVVATLFLFAAVYFTLARKNPLLAGLCLGAAYMSRYPTILSLPFFIIMFSDQWLPESRKGEPLLRRFDLVPLLKFGLGLGALILLNAVYNYLRFDTPLDASYHYRDPAILTEPYWQGPEFQIAHMKFHFPVIFRQLPAFQSDAPYVLAPNFVGMAIWATTPAFVYAFFTDIKQKPLIIGAIALFLFPVTLFILSARGMPFEGELDLPYGAHYYPFAILVAMAIGAAAKRRNKLALACWAAVVPTALLIFSYAATGWAQYGYRYAIDYYPFLFMLTILGMGPELRWHQKTLILASVGINLWAVLAIYQFQPDGFLDLTWTTT